MNPSFNPPIQQSTHPTLPYYPARPVNGGSLPKALPKSGDWFYEPKVNGWRALVHTPTGTMFNRKGERLSIEKEFREVLARLCGCTRESAADFTWLDVECFERRHPLGRGSLILLDAPGVEGSYLTRQQAIYDGLVAPGIAQSWAHEQFEPPTNALLAFAYSYETVEQQAWLIEAVSGTRHGLKPDADIDPLKAWARLQSVNKALGCDLFEGLVAKRGDSPYPKQHRSPDVEFPFWVKHRWAF